MDIAKLAGVDALKLVVMIVQATRTVRHNKKTCQQLVQHVQIIGDLLEKLQTSEMMQQPEIRNGLNELEQILREAYMLVTSCQNSNYVYHLFMGAKRADQFRVLQNRLNSCLQVFPTHQPHRHHRSPGANSRNRTASSIAGIKRGTETVCRLLIL
ncbi:unnamed protein product [Urochloa humidicola]